jgi:hypothetical protein
LKCDGTRWRTGGKWGENWRMEWVASTLHTTSVHGVSSITTADAHTSAASSRLNWRPPPGRFKWTRPFRRKTKSGFCACAVTFQTQSTIFCSRVQLKCDGTRWRTGGEVKGELANAVGSQYSSHYLGTRCIQHYYCWCRTPRLPAVDWTDAPHPADLSGLVRFAERRNLVSARVPSHFDWPVQCAELLLFPGAISQLGYKPPLFWGF